MKIGIGLDNIKFYCDISLVKDPLIIEPCDIEFNQDFGLGLNFHTRWDILLYEEFAICFPYVRLIR